MSKFRLHATAAMAAALLGIGCTAASAQVFCVGTSTGSASEATYHGYGDEPADPGSPGTSTIVTGTTFTTVAAFNPETEQCETVGTRTTTTVNYIDGPGNSPYDQFDSSTCEATGTLSCP